MVPQKSKKYFYENNRKKGRGGKTRVKRINSWLEFNMRNKRDPTNLNTWKINTTTLK